MTALLEVEGLNVHINSRHGALKAIDAVSFVIAAGEVLGVVGESGAGKSLTGTAVLGLLESPAEMTGGQILLEGRRIDQLDEEDMRALRGPVMGAVFQDPLTTLNPLQTVGRQLAQTITTHFDVSASEARTQARQLLAEVGIPAPDERLDSYPHQLSGGMRQRVVLALAFCCQPKLIIADEPTTALDVSIQAQVIDLMKRMCRDRGTAVMLITHDMGVIAETADRVAVMYAGRLVEVGPTAAILKHPAHPYTRGLMASIPSMRRRHAELYQVEGSMPRLDALPSGCAFHPRCPEVMERCARERPELHDPAGPSAACWLAADGAAGRA